MRRLLLLVALLAFCAVPAFAQDSEFSGGGGGTAGAITAGVGSGNAGRVPQFASATSVVDSKMLTSGTNSGTWTLYDSTGGSGLTRLILRAGDTQADGGPLLEVFNSAGASMTGNYGVIMYNSGSYYMVAPDIISPARGSFALAANGLRLSTSAGVNFSSNGNDYGTADVALYRSAAGILKVTDGSTGSGGIGISDAATNTVTDALILRHATSGTAAASFGTGLQFQGETDAGVMRDMASIDAEWLAVADASPHGQLVFRNVFGGSTSTMLTMLQQYGDTYLGAPGGVTIDGTSVTIGSAANVVNIGAAFGVRWTVPSTGHFTPAADNTYDIGTPSAKVKDGYFSTSIQGTRTKTLTDTVATDFVTIAIPNNTSVGGTIEYTITYTSGGNQEIESGVLAFAGQNEAGTEAASVSAVGTALQLPAGTMTNVFAVTTGTDNMTISCDADSTALAADPVIAFRVYVNSGTATVTPTP